MGVGDEIGVEVFLQAILDKSGCFWHWGWRPRRGQGHRTVWGAWRVREGGILSVATSGPCSLSAGCPALLWERGR